MSLIKYESESIKLSFVVSYYNEETIIKGNTIEIIRQLHTQFPRTNYELILVNDNSSDRSFKFISQFGAKYPIHFMNFSFGPSRRENLAQVMKEARGGIVCFFDMDLSCDINFLKNIIDTIDIDGFDIAIGNRYHPLSILKRSFGRNLISIIYNPLVRILWNSQLHDHQCGFKAFRKSVLTPLLDEMGYDQTLTRGWFWDTELLIRAQRKNYTIKEIPVRWESDAREKRWFAFLRDEIKIIFYILRVYKELR